MLFNSFTFLLGFLPAALVIYRLADPHPRLRTWTLILLSIGFYGYWNPWLVGLLVLSILFNWFAAQYYASTRRGSIITAAIIANLAILGLFKYANFVVDNVEFVVGVPIGRLDLALPLGISFFTFHHVMYLVDLRRGRAERPPLDRYALTFVSSRRPLPVRLRAGPRWVTNSAEGSSNPDGSVDARSA